MIEFEKTLGLVQLLFGVVLLRNVFVGCNPAASRNRLVHDTDPAPVVCFHDKSSSGPLSDGCSNFGTILFDIPGKASSLLTMTNEFMKRTSGLHHI